MDIWQSRGEHVVEFYRALKGAPIVRGALFYGRMLKALFAINKRERERERNFWRAIFLILKFHWLDNEVSQHAIWSWGDRLSKKAISNAPL